MTSKRQLTLPLYHLSLKKIHIIFINDIPDADLIEKKTVLLKIIKENKEGFLILIYKELTR